MKFSEEMRRNVVHFNDTKVNNDIYKMILSNALFQIKANIRKEVEKSGKLNGKIFGLLSCDVYSTELKNVNNSIRKELEGITHSKKETDLYVIDRDNYDNCWHIYLQYLAVEKINKGIFGTEATVSLTLVGKKFCDDIQQLAKAEGIVLKPIPSPIITHKSGYFGSGEIINQIPDFDTKIKLRGELRHNETLRENNIYFLFELQ